MIQFTCTGCQAKLQVTDDMAGKKGKCPKCGHPVLIPSGLRPIPMSERQLLGRAEDWYAQSKGDGITKCPHCRGPTAIGSDKCVNYHRAMAELEWKTGDLVSAFPALFDQLAEARKVARAVESQACFFCGENWANQEAEVTVSITNILATEPIGDGERITYCGGTYHLARCVRCKKEHGRRDDSIGYGMGFGSLGVLCWLFTVVNSDVSLGVKAGSTAGLAVMFFLIILMYIRPWQSSAAKARRGGKSYSHPVVRILLKHGWRASSSADFFNMARWRFPRGSVRGSLLEHLYD